MNPILPSDVPFVIGFIAIVVALFWLVGRAARSGVLSRRSRPGIALAAGLCFGISAVVHATDRHWGWAVFYASGALFYLVLGRRYWHQS